VIHLTSQARTELKGDEALVFDWHWVAICCARAGEVSLRPAARERVEASRSFRPFRATRGRASTRTGWRCRTSRAAT
jgi:hypothetical protein